MNARIERLDAWLRSEFIELNTALEEVYFEHGVEFLEDPALDGGKRRLLVEGSAHAGAIDALPEDADARYELLGMVGFVLGACRRHEVEDPASQAPVWAVAQRLAEGLGVAPRYTFAHQAIFNTARDGRYRTFTSLPDETRFVELNTLGAFAYSDAAAALRRIPGLGVSHPLAGHMLDQARNSLEHVLALNQRLAHEVSRDRFFRNVRPYFKPHRVGETTQRGPNGGDFAAINEIDVLLGVAAVDAPFYWSVVDEKIPYVIPVDQVTLRQLPATPSLLARFEDELRVRPTPRLCDNAARFLAVCRAHGAAYAFHHHALVKPFLERPAAAAPPSPHTGLSASGPPLREVIAMLERLRNMRTDRGRLAELRQLAQTHHQEAV